MTQIHDKPESRRLQDKKSGAIKSATKGSYQTHGGYRMCYALA
jgi:hypothetical protein